MEINVKKFVDINISRHETSAEDGTRPIVTLLLSNADDDVSAYEKIFNDNGGIALEKHVLSSSTPQTIANELRATLSKERIIIAKSESVIISMKEIAAAYNDLLKTNGDSGVYQKIFLDKAKEVPGVNLNVERYALKISKQVGAEMTMAAYLSKMRCYETDGVKDYAFTIEDIIAEDEDDDILSKVIDYDCNIDMTLSGAVRNLGGNTTNGQSLANEFCLIVLQQTVTDKVLACLMQKLKGQKGISSIYACICKEVSKYLTSGYLVNDRVWTDASIYKDGNLLIEKGQMLQQGFWLTILPYSSLSDDDKKNGKCPPIYLYLAEAYGIREVKIVGEVF